MSDQLERATSILTDACDEHEPVHIYVGYSGGDDSLVTTHLTMQWAKHVDVPASVLHVNTGIGIPQTRSHVRETCDEMGWALDEYHAKEDCGQDYEQLVMEYGFPGPGHHRKMYNRLKERCIRLAVKEKKTAWKDRVLLATGIRAEESQRRAGYDRVMQRNGATVWVNPIYRWTGQHCYDYISTHDLPRNPVSEKLGMSGECLCGAFAHKGEKEMIRLVSPETADRIERLEEKIWAAGHKWRWEEKPTKALRMEREGQRALFERPFCNGCGKRGTEPRKEQ